MKQILLSTIVVASLFSPAVAHTGSTFDKLFGKLMPKTGNPRAPKPKAPAKPQTSPKPSAKPKANPKPQSKPQSKPEKKTPPPVAQAPTPKPAPTRRLTMTEPTRLRILENGILEPFGLLPTGSIVEVSESQEVMHFNYRGKDGQILWSSTGFVGGVKVIWLPRPPEDGGSADIADLNSKSPYVAASVLGNVESESGNFQALPQDTPPNDDYLRLYTESGKPKFDYTSRLRKRFGQRLNAAIDPTTLSSEERTKWQAIFNELKRAADRSVETPRTLLLISKELADKKSRQFESTGVIPTQGAWTIAVQSTSVRHGFSNVPCAEFMSEMVRQAYQRAGYKLTHDFNSQKKNELIWHNSAAVVRLSEALFIAGWIPWSTAEYRPPTGALLMNASGNTPGHAFISAGADGRIIVDNSSPKGRDLRKTSFKITNMMYSTGVFFLPPGINPLKW